eukprot:gnl/MRDRNA2_/MRDRNA2_253782_c0_seq1.p1 gnl/MRDRNA2_/MRDRNA2_253782_c0~~gnl/MRDRNA2_/MRDRNA2_253782_c0_seq1.p1  ORF type:complete len:101 (+),score=20.58 gnl/MRDRNA2_/MRDRNA2_253782_c0_seq1:2-304(+)
MISQMAGKCKHDELQSQLHNVRILAGLQAYLAEEPSALEEMKVAYNIISTVVVQYARAKLDLTFEGIPSLDNLQMRRAISKRLRLGHNGYFKSDLFWGSK